MLIYYLNEAYNLLQALDRGFARVVFLKQKFFIRQNLPLCQSFQDLFLLQNVVYVILQCPIIFILNKIHEN